MNTEQNKPIYYAVRRPGCVAWAERLTEQQARAELSRANNIVPGHRIVAHYRDGTAEYADGLNATGPAIVGTDMDTSNHYIVPGHHDRAETRHPTLAEAIAAARALYAEGYPASVRDPFTGTAVWTPTRDPDA